MVPQHPDLLIDGYLSHMFSSRDAEKYHCSLLRESRPIQWSFILPGGIFVAAPPSGLESNQEAWPIDYAIKDMGLVIPQQIWAPRTAADAQRYVHHERLCPPIFFALNDGANLGLPLKAAAAGDCRSLRGAEQTAGVGSSAHTQIRIKWRGYQHLEWNDQIMTQKGSQSKETISLGKFAKYVAGKVVKFMETAKLYTYHDGDDSVSDQRWLIADHGIAPQHVILIGVVHVSQGSWMPILQVKDGFALSLG